MNLPGYTSGTSAVARSPLTLADFVLMKKSVLFADADADAAHLRASLEVVRDHVEAILDVW